MTISINGPTLVNKRDLPALYTPITTWYIPIPIPIHIDIYTHNHNHNQTTNIVALRIIHPIIDNNTVILLDFKPFSIL